MVMISEQEGFIPIEEKLRRLSIKANVIVISILDCCRNSIESKAKIESSLPDYG
jgi:hypothetical protein